MALSLRADSLENIAKYFQPGPAAHQIEIPPGQPGPPMKQS